MNRYEMLNNKLMELIDRLDTVKGQDRIDCLTEIEMINDLINEDVQTTMLHNDKIINRYRALIKR